VGLKNVRIHELVHVGVGNLDTRVLLHAMDHSEAWEIGIGAASYARLGVPISQRIRAYIMEAYRAAV